MIRLKSALQAAGLASAGLLLAACVTVFPETKPVQLYRFGPPPAAEAQAEPTAAPAPAPVAVYKARTGFARPVATDRILTITGSEAAYIADARWIAPANELFDEALAQAFDEAGGPARLAVRGQASRAQFTLRMDVRNFEAVYDRGGRQPPVVLVRVRAVLMRSPDSSVVVDRTVEKRVRADTNRIGAIVQAFEASAGEAITELVALTNAAAAQPAAGA
ncbi:MAG: ABC-type transport auxiliary lipoprotein family protein [Phenylobacterium sp.]|uniref:ABC-type transport auxiliary lipoprotein family protein n=1 Tax=Phenylobacterium sp. TaxID=1871053 RepID=UPI003919EE3D